MIGTWINRWLGVTLLVVAVSTVVRAQSYTGNTFVDFATLGRSSCNVDIWLDYTMGDDEEASAWANFGGISASSTTNFGTAQVYLSFYKIHSVKGHWIAESVYIATLDPDAINSTILVYHDVPLPAAGWATGNMTWNGNNFPVHVSIY